MNRRRVRPPVMEGELHKDVVGGRLAVLDEDIPVTIAFEYAGVDQLELVLLQTAPRVFLHQLRVWVFPLRILVEHPEIRMGRRRVQVVVVLLHVLAVVALRVRQSEQSFFQERVFAVPECERQAQPLFRVADAGESVLAPAIGTAACVVVRKVVPRVSIRRVVLAHRSPLALADIRSPEPPRWLALLLQPAVFSSGRCHGRHNADIAFRVDPVDRH